MSIDAPNFDQAAQRPAADNQFRFVFGVLSEYWWQIAVSVAVGMGLFGGVAYLRQEVTPPSYRAHADVVVIPSPWQQDLLRDVGGATLFPVTPRALKERTSVRLLSEEVVRAMVQHDIAEGGPLAHVATEQELVGEAERLAERLDVQALDEAQKIRLEVTGMPSHEEAARAAEFAARVFVEQNRQSRLDEGRETHNFINTRLEELQLALFDAESAEWEFRQRMGFRAYGKIDQEMAERYEELNELGVLRNELQARLAELDQELLRNTRDLPQALGHVTDAVVERLFEELDDLLQLQMTMSAVYQPAYPGLQQLADDIAEKQRTILEAIERLDEGASGGSNIWRQRQEIYSRRMDLRMQLTAAEVRIGSLERMLDDLIPRIPELANRKLEYEQLAQETESIREQFNKLRQREWQVRNALAQGGGQIERYDPVKAAPIPIGPGGVSVWVNALIGGLAGFVFAFAIALMREANDTSIRSIEDVHEYIGLEVIGTIPRMRFGRPRGGRRRRATYVSTVDEEQIDACIVTQHDPKSPISEAYRTLRTNFQFATMKEKPRTVMITSAVPGEGKTTTAVNMAVTMADRGIRVLIVDTDLRRPNVHRVLRMERGPGLADALREGLDMESVIRPTRIENLWIISSGRVPPNPSELIGSDRMAQIMERLGEQFDLVICDAPSSLVVTDPVLLATHVDTCCMVVSTNNARRDTVVRAKKLLETANVHIAGVIVNGLETTRRHYYYYYYYYDDGSAARRKWYHFF